jgi:hypothetical protein
MALVPSYHISNKVVMNLIRWPQSIIQAVIVLLAVASAENAWGQKIGLLSYSTPAYLQFTSEVFAEFDADNNAVISIIRTGEFREPVSVSYATRDGTAMAGVDYAHTSGTLLIPAGMAMAEFQVPILLDHLPRAPRTVELLLSDPGPNGMILQERAILNIIDPLHLGTVELPRLTIRQATDGQIVISWPISDLEPVLEKSKSAIGGDWIQVSGELQVADGMASITEPATSEHFFYRLKPRYELGRPK